MSETKKTDPEKDKITKARLGRTPLPKEKRLSKKITVNLTEIEFKKLRATAKNHFNIELPKLVRALLQKHKEI